MRIRTAVCSLALVFAIPAFADVPQASLDRGYHYMYNLQFPEAQKEFKDYQDQNFRDPVGYVSEAAANLFSELSRLGVLETKLFEDDSNFDSRKKLVPDPQVKEAFESAIRRTEM